MKGEPKISLTIKINPNHSFTSETDGSRRNSMVERRQSVLTNQPSVNILNNNDLSDSCSSLHTLIFHGLQEDWMEQNMETLDKKQMVLELNFRKVNQLKNYIC